MNENTPTKTKFLRTIPANKIYQNEYLIEDEKTIENSIKIFISHLTRKIEKLSVGGKEYMTYKDKTYSARMGITMI